MHRRHQRNYVRTDRRLFNLQHSICFGCKTEIEKIASSPTTHTLTRCILLRLRYHRIWHSKGVDPTHFILILNIFVGTHQSPEVTHAICWIARHNGKSLCSRNPAGRLPKASVQGLLFLPDVQWRSVQVVYRPKELQQPKIFREINDPHLRKT